MQYLGRCPFLSTRTKGHECGAGQMISVRFQGKPFSITVIQVYAPTTNAQEAEVDWFYDDLQDLLELTPKKDVSSWGIECKSRPSRDIWIYRQVWPYRVLPRECTGHSKHPLPTTQETILYMDITIWSILKSDWLYSLQPKMENLYTVSKNKTGNWLWLKSWTPYCKIQT